MIDECGTIERSTHYNSVWCKGPSKTSRSPAGYESRILVHAMSHVSALVLVRLSPCLMLPLQLFTLFLSFYATLSVLISSVYEFSMSSQIEACPDTNRSFPPIICETPGSRPQNGTRRTCPCNSSLTSPPPLELEHLRLTNSLRPLGVRTTLFYEPQLISNVLRPLQDPQKN